MQTLNYYNFTAHNVFTLPANTDRVFAAPDKLLVTSLTRMTICVHDLGSKGSITHELETQGPVRWAEYCAANNAIATIENGTLYVYGMWWSPECRPKPFGSAEVAAWCQSSGKLATSDGRTVTVYEDLKQLFELSGLAGIRELSLCEHILAVRTATHVVVVDLAADRYSCRDEDEIVWNFDRDDLIVNARSLASPPKIDRLGSPSKIPENLTEVYLADRPIYGLNLRLKNSRNDVVSQPTVVLLKKIQPTHMSLIAYHSCDDQTTPDPLAATQAKLDSVTLLLATSTHCDLFRVFGGRGSGSVSFAGPVESIAVDECFVHVLKEDCLETYALPLADLSGDWVPFHLSTHRMAMKQLLMSRDHLVVLSSRDLGDLTVYSLLKPTTSEFFADIPDSADEAVRGHAKDIVRLQCRVHGKNCSERLLALYSSIEETQAGLTVADLLDGKVEAQQVEEVVAKTDQALLLKDGALTELGEKLLNAHPAAFKVILSKNTRISPKVLRAQMAKATPEMAQAIARYVSSHLGRIEGVKIHRKLLQNSVPPWVYELQPFNGSAPDPQCSSEPNCRCLRCTAQLLYAAVVLSSSPLALRLSHVFPALPNDAPDILRLACLLPMTKTSAADPADFVCVVDDIVAAVSPYTQRAQPSCPHLLTVLSDVLALPDFLRCIPEGSHSFVPWVQNGLMRRRAQVLKEEIVGLGEELRVLIP